MSRYIAFLRAINAGPGRTAKMDSIRQVFEALGFSDVSTFQAIGIFSQAPPERVFPLVGDLLRHPAWATDQMKMEALSAGSIRLGEQYRSTTNFKGMVVLAELEIIEYQPPTLFAFTVNDRTGKYNHEFVLHSQLGGTLVERSISNENTDLISKILTIILMPILIVPESKKALEQLKSRVKQA